MFTIAILAIIAGLLFVGKFVYENNKQKTGEKKEFIVLGTTMLLIWLFPGAALIIIGLVLVLLLS